MKEKNNNPKPGKNQNGILNSPIREIPTFQEVQNEITENTLACYTIDDMIDIWCRGVTNGATLWQYCQDKNLPLPVSFEAGLIELVNEIRNSEDKPRTLQDFINNNMILLGVFEEKQ